ncbi:unnamed protein product [Blumeria hordei]|uniref:Uncharacterized protein n=1 Tax=Blumeria hordei TaxID=2867405 RepID=A0A383UU65_BLUHO|nr:unnamed protein product [Blumeria hordei]
MFKPFKSPLLRGAPPATSYEDEKILESPPGSTKKLNHSDNVNDSSLLNSTSPTIFPHKSKSIVSLKPSPIENSSDIALRVPEAYYMVLWFLALRKFTNKKHKTWDGDGVLSISGGYARLQDISGTDMGRVMFKDPLLPGSTLNIGGKAVEIDSIITKEDFMAGKPFLRPSNKRTSSADISLPAPKRIRIPPTLPSGKVPLATKKVEPSNFKIPAASFYAHKSTKTITGRTELKTTKEISPPEAGGIPVPRHDISGPGALVMTRPTNIERGKQLVDVVVDPFLGQHLRAHQREGVKFLYECVMGMRDFNGNGAILADEMGLGKSLTTIALIWTLLKQAPIYGTKCIIKKALIVCPVTLISNWKKEFKKWLGNERIGVFIADNRKNKLTDFTHGRSYNVMIIGYEKLRSVQEELKKGHGIDIVIADEGHRLKTAQNKSAQAIRSLSTPKKIILSGTPIQNDLSEFFEMVDFVNPGLLGTYKTFTKEFENPIIKSRQPGASPDEVEKGIARQEELSSLTQMFILRRTAEILSKYLPPKNEYVLFCKPTQAQIQAYEHILALPSFGNVLASSEASFQLINFLKKLCNAPSLLAKKKEKTSIFPSLVEHVNIIPDELLRLSPIIASSKLRVLDLILKRLSQNTTEKVVIVSNYTTTLDLLGKHLASLDLPFLRLDGSTPTLRRQDLVDTFNKTSAAKNFAFLLSAKSGGAGINLIGASRLFLFDTDWNPATDLQAMARIHRDGQKKPVKIYRFLLGGGIDEKIYQRQITKMGLADSIVDGKQNEASFSAEELRDLFRLHLNTRSQTHDLLGCACPSDGSDPLAPTCSASAEKESDTKSDSEASENELVYPLIYKPVPATKDNVAAINQKIAEELEAKRAKKMKNNMQALMQYRHIDTTIFGEDSNENSASIQNIFTDTKEALDDDILHSILKEKKSSVAFVFAKKDRI